MKILFSLLAFCLFASCVHSQWSAGHGKFAILCTMWQVDLF